MSKSKFVSFITAGDPSLDDTRKFIDVLSEYSDIIELGIPFSDPIAEGEVIQDANIRALENGVTADDIFDMLKTVAFDKIVLLTYINPVYVYGRKKFFDKCKETGVYGVIVPDLPFEERGEIAAYAEDAGVHLITLIAPNSADRVQMLAENATGFIYLVSSMGTTGTRKQLTIDLTRTISQIREVTDTPIMVGFGISTPEQVAQIGKIADGVIVGSALVRIIAEHGANSRIHLEKELKRMIGNV